MLFVISPILAREDSASASAFLTGFLQWLPSGEAPHVLDHNASLSVMTHEDDFVVVCNPPLGTRPHGYIASVRAFLQRALASGATVLPVAVDRDSLEPHPR